MTVSQYSTVAALNGLFKEIYADSIESLLPDVAKLTKLVKFNQSERLGNYYHQPVIVKRGNGVTFSAAGDGAVALNTSSSMASKDAQVQGARIVMRQDVPTEVLDKTVGNKAAFKNATEMLLEQMLEDVTYHLELGFLYGGSGIAKVASSANASSTSTVLTIMDAHWSAGIFAGAEDALVNFYNATSLVSSSTDAIFTISAVDADNKKITVTGTSTGISALDSAISGAANTIDMYFKGAYGKECSGLKKIISNTGSLFGIDAAVYSLWKGNSITETGSLTMGKIQKGIAKAVSRGLNEKVLCLVSPATFAVLAAEATNLQQFNKAGDMEIGASSLKYAAPSGIVEVHAHLLCKDGDCFIVPTAKLKRIGSTEVTFKNPGSNEDFFMPLADNDGYSLRCRCDQALFLETPARAVYISGFSN